ncbi:MAG: hypothetical protein H7X70_02890 [Candidatus Kapabacteria bacterium]|nr:hypothetical protein [Candidatus Kapabacteria bacterium]
MTLKGGLIAVVITAFVTFLLDFLFYGFLMPMPTDFKAAMGTVMYTEATMPNPVWYYLMELVVAGLVAFATLQVPLTLSQAAQRGALVLLMVTAAIDISWGMSINVSWPISTLFIELAFRAVVGAIAGSILLILAKRFSGSAA